MSWRRRLTVDREEMRRRLVALRAVNKSMADVELKKRHDRWVHSDEFKQRMKRAWDKILAEGEGPPGNPPPIWIRGYPTGEKPAGGEG